MNENKQDRPASAKVAEGKQETMEVVRRNWQAEVETAQSYRDLAELEPDEKRKGILIRMAEAEERHAERWEKKLRDMGTEPPQLRDTLEQSGRRRNRHPPDGSGRGKT